MTAITKSNFIQRLFTAIIFGSILATIFIAADPAIFSLFLITALVIMLVELYQILDNPTYFALCAPIYPTVPLIILIYFNQSQEYRLLLGYLFCIIFTFDSMSYLVGSCIGYHKIIPSISAGKSWQGFAGGYFCTTLLIYFLQQSDTSFAACVVISLIVCIIAFAGDIFESYLKRLGHKKDSGFLLPGHGGFLDRFDAILSTALFASLFKNQLLYFFTKTIL